MFCLPRAKTIITLKLTIYNTDFCAMPSQKEAKYDLEGASIARVTVPRDTSSLAESVPWILDRHSGLQLKTRGIRTVSVSKQASEHANGGVKRSWLRGTDSEQQATEGGRNAI